MANRWSVLVSKSARTATVAAALVILGSVAHTQTYFHGNPNIWEPASGRHRVGHAHTCYLIFLGSDPRRPYLRSPEESRSPIDMLVGPPSGYSPTEVQGAYGIPGSGGLGTIAIVDAFDDPDALSEFNTFAAQYGLPQEPSGSVNSNSNRQFQVIYSSGSRPAANVSWAGEAALDFEWAHAMAPNAKIILVEAPSDYNTDLDAAVNVAKLQPNVKQISMSWGLDEYSNEALEDSTFVQSGTTFFSAAGDVSATPTYPAESPNVVGVGGTSLQLDQYGGFISETAWTDGGGGPSAYEPRPNFQDSIQAIIGSQRSNPDISAVADPNYGLAVYSSYGNGGWVVVGGTSASTAVCAGIANARGYWALSSHDELSRIYGGLHNSSYIDITAGSNSQYSAGPGWDFATGFGPPYALYNASYVSYPALLAEIVLGYYRSGNLSSLVAVDGNTYTLGTIADGPWQLGQIQINYTIDRDAFKVLALQLNLTVAAVTGSTLQVYALNFTTGQYDQLLVTSAGSSMAPHIAYLPTPANYINASRHVQFVVRSFANRSAPYWFQIDQAQMAGQALP